ARNAPTNRLQLGRSLATLVGLRAPASASWASHGRTLAAGAGGMHGGLARRQPRHHVTQSARFATRRMDYSPAHREHHRAHQHYALLLAATSCSFASLGGSSKPSTESD